MKVAKHNHSQSIVIAKDLKQPQLPKGFKAPLLNLLLIIHVICQKMLFPASDIPITIHDVNVASQGRIGLIIVPFADKEVVNQADKYNIGLITTGFTNILF